VEEEEEFRATHILRYGHDKRSLMFKYAAFVCFVFLGGMWNSVVE
jgi:hypothetical protein